MTDADVLSLETGERLAPEAVEALAQETAVRQHGAEGVIERIDDALASLERGDTSWQIGTDARITTVVNSLDVIERRLGTIDANIAILVKSVRDIMYLLMARENIANGASGLGDH